MKLTKVQKIILILLLIIAIVSIFLVILNFNQKTPSPTNISTNPAYIVPLINDINSSVTGITFNISNSININKMKVYSAKRFDVNDLKPIADKLQMTQEASDSNLGVTIYRDEIGNNISYQPSANDLRIINQNNPNLKGFSKENTLQKISDLFQKDLSFYFLSNSVLNSNGYDVYEYSLKIKSFPLLQDFNDQVLLRITLKGDTLEGLSWQYVLPEEKEDVAIKDLDYIKKNIFTLDKGIYPNFSFKNTNSTDLNIYVPRVYDFQGKIDINAVELSYLWSNNKPDLIIPVYRFSGKFSFEDGNVLEGAVIVAAV
jgi:hypothetical protein